MGDAQSAQRDNKKDAAAEEESGRARDAPAEQKAQRKPLKNNAQISEINGKADSTIPEVNGHCEEEVAAEAILSPEEDASETAKSPKEGETPLEKDEMNENESPNDADANEEVPLEMTEIDAKQNDINESFRRFFSNIGLKLTVKRGSAEKAEIAADVPDKTNEEESNRPEYIEGTTKDTKSENAEQNIDLNTAQETYDNDSTTCPTLTEATSEDVIENAEERTTEAREGTESDNVDPATTSAQDDEKVQQNAKLEEDVNPTLPSSPETEVVLPPIKRFFTSGIFSGLRKKKKPADNDTNEKELVEMGKKEAAETAGETVDVQQDKEEISPGVEADAVEMGQKDNELKEEILSAASVQTTDDGKSPSTDAISIDVNEPEITSSQEKVQASPLKRLLSGSNLKKLSKKQRGRKSSDAKLSDSGEHSLDQAMPSTESAEHQKEESPAQTSTEAAAEEDGPWASFKKLVTPKKRMKMTNEETQVSGTAEETKPSEGEQISDHSTEEGKKRKDSSVSWEAVLCGSGRRRSRSRKTSDSEDETPQVEMKQESPLDSSNEVDEIVPMQAGSPSEADGGSTWKSFKKLVTPKKKGRDEEDNKDIIQSDSEVTQDDSSFSIKKLLPGRKKRKSGERQDQASSDEADKEAGSDEDSETPAVVPLSEFEPTETGVHIKTKAEVGSQVFKEAENEPEQDLLDQVSEPLLPSDNLQTETKEVQNTEDTSQNEESITPDSNEEPEDLTEIISKHQQLSDIPEEGAITETMVTEEAVTEEAARDDTIAEDLIEMTSEAITAPEPLDITSTDETEMISAVSQLSESSKTSGNTTPVPVEYDIKQTEALLHQVVETISTNPQAASLCSGEMSPERIVGSVSHQILETFVKEEPAILEIHRKSDATAIKIGLNVEELEVSNELATAQTESISEVNEGVSTEIVSEVPIVKIDTAETAVDEVHEVSVLHPEESIKELESTDDSQHQVGNQCETNAGLSLETLPKGEEIVTDECSPDQIHQDEKEPLEIEEAESVSSTTLDKESEDGGVEQEVQTEKLQIKNITDQIEVEEEDQQPVGDLQETVQAATLDSEVQLEKEITSIDIPASETAIDEPKEQEKQPEELEAAQSAPLDSEEGSVQLIEKEVTSEDIPTTETPKPKEEIEPLTEDTFEVEKGDELQPDEAKTELNEEPQEPQEPEVSTETVETAPLDSEEAGVQSLEKDVVSEDAPEPESVTDEVKVETQSLVDDNKTADASETEDVREPEVEDAQVTKLDSEEGSVQSIEEEVISEPTQAPESSVEEGSAQEPERQIITEAVTVTDETQKEDVAEQEPKSTPLDVKVMQEDNIAQVENELETLTAVHVASVNEGTCNVQVRENVFSEVSPPTCVDNAEVTQELSHEVHLGAVHASVEGEKERELPGAEVKSAAVEHATVTQVITCHLKDVSAAIPDAPIEKPSEICEALIGTVGSEREIKETVMWTEPLVKDEETKTAEEGTVVTMMNVPSVQLEDKHSIQVKVDDVDIKSAEVIVDKALEVGVTEAKEVIDVCHETVEEVDKLSATSETEESINQENKVTIQKVVQHVKENLPEAAPEAVLTSLEEKVTKQPDAAAKASEIGEQKVAEDLTQTLDIPESSDVSAHDLKQDLEEAEPQLEKSEAEVKTEEVKISSEELDGKTICEEAQIPQIAQSQIVTQSNSGLVVPANSGIISSIGNVESPSSLSLEFKLNIHFGQTKAPASPPPAMERPEPAKKSEAPEVSVKTVEPEKETIPSQNVESHKHVESTEAAVQTTENTEPPKLSSTDKAGIINQPLLLDVGVQAVERVHPVEEIKSTEKVTPSVHVAETIEPIKQTEKREVFLSQPALSEAREKETKAKEPAKQTEEENDQEVWLDAEEEINSQGEAEASTPKGEEPKSKTEDKESQQEMLKTGAAHEVDSEGENFDVAPEHQQTAAAGIEWD